MSKLSFLILLGVFLSGCASKQEICSQLSAGNITLEEAYEKFQLKMQLPDDALICWDKKVQSHDID
tara:strand:+ start:398 stop:595 length:198 start_codon:yes stop_codon:yes gene_type:complete